MNMGRLSFERKKNLRVGIHSFLKLPTCWNNYRLALAASWLACLFFCCQYRIKLDSRNLSSNISSGTICCFSSNNFGVSAGFLCDVLWSNNDIYCTSVVVFILQNSENPRHASPLCIALLTNGGISEHLPLMGSIQHKEKSIKSTFHLLNLVVTGACTQIGLWTIFTKKHHWQPASLKPQYRRPSKIGPVFAKLSKKHRYHIWSSILCGLEKILLCIFVMALIVT